MVALKFGEELGGGPLSWEGVVMVVVYGEVSGWAGEFLTKMSSIRLGGGGDKVKLWKDRWCGDLLLQLAFPVL